jgi:hypothetical protein
MLDTKKRVERRQFMALLRDHLEATAKKIQLNKVAAVVGLE